MNSDLTIWLTKEKQLHRIREILINHISHYNEELNFYIENWRLFLQLKLEGMYQQFIQPIDCPYDQHRQPFDYDFMFAKQQRCRLIKIFHFFVTNPRTLWPNFFSTCIKENINILDGDTLVHRIHLSLVTDYCFDPMYDCKYYQSKFVLSFAQPDDLEILVRRLNVEVQALINQLIQSVQWRIHNRIDSYKLIKHYRHFLLWGIPKQIHRMKLKRVHQQLLK